MVGFVTNHLQIVPSSNGDSHREQDLYLSKRLQCDNDDEIRSLLNRSSWIDC